MSLKKLKRRKEIKDAGILKGGTSKEYKTGAWKDLVPIVDEGKCVNCLKCVNYCPESAIELTKKGKRGKVNYDYCKGCGICVEICPVNAIKMYTPDKAKKLLKKKRYTKLKDKKRKDL